MKKIIYFILFYGFVKVFFWFDDSFLKTDTFKVKKILKSEDFKIVEKEILKSSEYFEGKYIWEIDTISIENFLKKDVRIKSANIEIQLPNTIKIEIETKKPSYYISYNGEVLGVDKEMQIITYIDDYPVKDLPILTINNVKEIKTLVKILEKIKGSEIEKMISQIYLINKKNIEITLIDGIKIKTNEDVDLKKYQVTEQLYLNLKSGKELKGEISEYIDIRFSDYIVK